MCFAIKSISIEEFATITNCFKEQENVGIETGYSFGVNPDVHSVFVNFSLMFKCLESPFIILKISCGFEVEQEGFLKFENKDKSLISVPKEFLTHLIVLTIGTARGILHAKLEKSGFEQFILPAINVSDVIQEDVEFQLSQN